MISAGDFRNGITLEIDGIVYQIMEFQHVKPGKGAAFVRTKIKNVMNGGVVEQMGTPQETYYSPKSAFVADFIGEANFLEGVVEKHDVMKIADVSVPVKTGDMAAGTACRLVLRPESVTLKDTGILPCKVVYSCFMGSYQSYHVQVKDMLVKLEEYNPKNKRIYQVGEDAFLNFEEGTVFPL